MVRYHIDTEDEDKEQTSEEDETDEVDESDAEGDRRRTAVKALKQTAVQDKAYTARWAKC